MELKDLRNALLGFNKNDVCEYISQLNYVYEQKEEQRNKDQREVLKELNRKNEELNNCNSRLNQENTELKRINDELQKKIESAERRSNDLEHQIEEIRKTALSVLEEVKEQLNLSEKRISTIQTEQVHKNEP